MRVTYENPPEVEGGLIVHLVGSLNVQSAAMLWETASQLVDATTRFVVIDFTRVTMLTSAGIGILVRIYTRLKGHGGGLAIFGCNAKIREIFAIVMLNDVLHVCGSETEAWEAIRTSAPGGS